MAEIYLARVVGQLDGFEKQVVLKCVAPHFADREDYVAMFLDEARMAAVLDHPNIAQVHDIGFEDGNWYFTMEYVRGCNLRDLLNRLDERDEQLPLDIAVAIVKGVLLGLAAAHDARGKDGKALQLVHRDVSPPNVVVGLDGNVKLIDFGIAKANARRTQTMSGVVKGKYAYMSPEQCRGQPLDRRSDIFSTGILLFELVTGRRLFHDPNEYVVMQKLLDGVIPETRALRPDVPRALEAIIDRALAQSPDDRFPTAESMYRALAKLHGMAASQFDTADLVRRVFSDEVRPTVWPDGSNPEGAYEEAVTEEHAIEREGTDKILRALRERFTSPSFSRARTLPMPMQLRRPSDGGIPLDLAGTADYATFEILTVDPGPPETPSTAATTMRLRLARGSTPAMATPTIPAPDPEPIASTSHRRSAILVAILLAFSVAATIGWAALVA